MVTATMLKRNGLSATFVAYKGGPDVCTALAQNELHFAMTALPLIVPFKGRIRALSLMIDQRSPMMPGHWPPIASRASIPRP
jgi:tripartite-type tricarboxylate transporter receptor subunit TctC